MRICFVSNNFCARTRQTMMAVKRAGHEVHAVFNAARVALEFMNEAETLSVWRTDDRRQMVPAIRAIDPDVIHVQDRPHDLMVQVSLAKFNCPIVYDPHDLDSYLTGSMWKSEPQALRAADAIVWPSASYMVAASKMHGLTQPSIFVPSMVCSHLFPTKRLARRRNVGVWEGGIVRDALHPKSPRHYLDQRPFIKAFRDAGMACDVYPVPTDQRIIEAFEAAGAVPFITQPYTRLLWWLTQYDFGWFGQVGNHPQIHGALPNKMFDYIAAGIPVLAINAAETAQFVEDNEVGVAIQRPEQAADPKVRERLETIRERLWERRHEFTRERACEPLLKLYEWLVSPHAEAVEENTHAEPAAL